MMRALRQTAHAFQVGILTTLARPRHMLLTGFGLLIAGLTLLILLTIPAGLDRLAGHTGLADVVMVMTRGMATESQYHLLRTQPPVAQLIGTLPGVAHTAGGQPMVAAQYVVTERMQRTDGSSASVIVRGVSPMFWKVIGDAVHVTSGARPRSGVDQLLAGATAARNFAGLATGDRIEIANTPWHVSGQFSANGGFWGSQLWTNLSSLQGANDAKGTISSVWVKLVSPAAFGRFATAVHADPRLDLVKLVRQPDYYTGQTRFLDVLIGTGTAAVALALGIGAILAIVNALGMALGARRRQLAILRAMGFGSLPIAIALLLEVLLVAVICVGITLLIGWLAINGREIGSSVMGSAVQFRLWVNAGVALRVLVYLVVLAAISSAWPIAAAVRAQVTTALQDE